MPQVTIDFHGARIIKHPNGSFCISVERDPVDLPMSLSNGHFMTEQYLVVPLSGPGWWRQMYQSIAFVFGRPGLYAGAGGGTRFRSLFRRP